MTETINNFSDFNITTESEAFTGTKIEIDSILNSEIMVHAFKVGPSKFLTENPNGKCLSLQVSVGTMKHVIFTGSLNLMQMIEKPQVKFPFKTKIIKENKRLLFT